LSERAATGILTSFWARTRAPIPSFGSLLAFGRQGTYLGRALSASLAFCMFCVTTRVQGSGACRAPRCKDGFGFVVCREQLGLHMMIPTAGLRPRDMCRCASIKHSLKQESCWPCEYADGRQSARGRASRGEGWPRGNARRCPYASDAAGDPQWCRLSPLVFPDSSATPTRAPSPAHELEFFLCA